MIIVLNEDWRTYRAGTPLTVTKMLGHQLLAQGIASRLPDDTVIEYKPTPEPIALPNEPTAPVHKKRGRPKGKRTRKA